jgi:AcrR family transcriptional regulator
MPPRRSARPHVVDADSDLGLRDRKKLRIRAVLIDVAFRLFREHGFDATTADDIANAAGVSRRTLFRYFPSKEDLVFAHNAERLQEFQTQLERRPTETPFAALRRALLQMASVYISNRREVVDRYRIVQSSPTLVARELELDRSWERAMQEALRSGAGQRADRRARLLAGATMGLVRAGLSEWFESGGRLDLRALGREALALLERSMGDGASAPRRSSHAGRAKPKRRENRRRPGTARTPQTKLFASRERMTAARA